MAVHPNLGARLLVATQRALIAIGFFCLTGAAALLLGPTPSVWPL